MLIVVVLGSQGLATSMCRLIFPDFLNKYPIRKLDTTFNMQMYWYRHCSIFATILMLLFVYYFVTTAAITTLTRQYISNCVLSLLLCSSQEQDCLTEIFHLRNHLFDCLYSGTKMSLHFVGGSYAYSSKLFHPYVHEIRASFLPAI